MLRTGISRGRDKDARQNDVQSLGMNSILFSVAESGVFGNARATDDTLLLRVMMLGKTMAAVSWGPFVRRTRRGVLQDGNVYVLMNQAGKHELLSSTSVWPKLDCM